MHAIHYDIRIEATFTLYIIIICKIRDKRRRKRKTN